MISPKIKWDHSQSWIVPTHNNTEMDKSAERTVKLNIVAPDFQFITGHTIDGR